MTAIKDIGEHYELGEALGDGSYGAVYKAKSKPNDTHVALK